MQEPRSITQSQSRKRLQEDGSAGIQDTPRYKVRAIVRDLRPHFIEVLRTPDFRNSKAANDIREGMKLLIDLYKDMVEQSLKRESCSNGDINDRQKPVEHHRDVKPADVLRHEVKPADIPPPQNGVSSIPPHNHAHGEYITGGSAFGWNFITFNGNTAAYYGRTKEAYRAANPISTE